MYIIIIHVYVCPKQVVLCEKWHSSLLVKIAKHKYKPAKCSTASACNNPSDSITEIAILEQFDYYNQKQNEVLYVNMEDTDFLPPTAPSLVFARETCTPYRPYDNTLIKLATLHYTYIALPPPGLCH